MRCTGRYIITLIAMSLLTGLVAIGCSEDETDCPVCPGAPSPVLDNLWPNDDGISWTYEWTRRSWETDPWTLFEDPGDVPAAPSFEYVEELLGDVSTGIDADTVSGIFRLGFDGTDSTISGATGQNLVETVFDERPENVFIVSFEAVFLSRIMTARPDLENALAGRAKSGGLPADVTAEIVSLFPILIHGGIWEKTAEYIGTYGDVDTLLAWKFLETDISTGHEFTFQLLPSLAGDIFLHCRILGRGTVETGYNAYRNAVECLYIIDHGMGTMELLEGTRYFRVYDYGTVTYAPGTGPVLSHERMLIDTAVPDGPGYGDNRLELIGTGSE